MIAQRAKEGKSGYFMEGGGKKMGKGMWRKALLVVAVALLTGGWGGKVLAHPGGGTSIVYAVNGVGDYLVAHLFDTNDRDTLIAITNTNPFFPELVHVRLRHGVNSDDVLDFNICLSCNDVWTAAITKTAAGAVQLTVNNPGSCDGLINTGAIPGPLTPAPLPNVALTLSNTTGLTPSTLNVPTFGYIEAFTFRSTSGAVCIPTDTNPMTAFSDPVLMGHAFYLDLGTGRGEARNWDGFVDFDSTDPTGGAPVDEGASGNAADDPIRAGLVTEAGNQGCTGGAFAGIDGVAQALASEGGVNKDILATRINRDPAIGGSTQACIVFPTGIFNVSDDLVAPCDITDADPSSLVSVSVFVFDENENVNLSPRQIDLPFEVNCLDLVQKINSYTLPFSLNTQSASGDILNGWMRLLNNGGSDNQAAAALSRFGMTGHVFQSVENTALADNFNVGFRWHWIGGTSPTFPLF